MRKSVYFGAKHSPVPIRFFVIAHPVLSGPSHGSSLACIEQYLLCFVDKVFVFVNFQHGVEF